jgi:hypothetical protein
VRPIVRSSSFLPNCVVAPVDRDGDEKEGGAETACRPDCPASARGRLHVHGGQEHELCCARRRGCPGRAGAEATRTLAGCGGGSSTGNRWPVHDRRGIRKARVRRVSFNNTSNSFSADLDRLLRRSILILLRPLGRCGRRPLRWFLGRGWWHWMGRRCRFGGWRHRGRIANTPLWSRCSGWGPQVFIRVW